MPSPSGSSTSRTATRGSSRAKASRASAIEPAGDRHEPCLLECVREVHADGQAVVDDEDLVAHAGTPIRLTESAPSAGPISIERQHLLGRAEQRRFARHAVDDGGRLVLRDGEAAGTADVEQAGGAVAAHAGQQNRRRRRPILARDRLEQHVDRGPARMPLGVVGQAQTAVAHREVSIGRRHHDAPGVRFDRIALAGIGRAAAGLPVEPLGERRRERLVDVQHEQNRAAGKRGGKRAQDLDDRARAAGRRADRHDLVALVASDLAGALAPATCGGAGRPGEPRARMRDHPDARDQLHRRQEAALPRVVRLRRPSGFSSTSTAPAASAS